MNGGDCLCRVEQDYFVLNFSFLVTTLNFFTSEKKKHICSRTWENSIVFKHNSGTRKIPQLFVSFFFELKIIPIGGTEILILLLKKNHFLCV